MKKLLLLVSMFMTIAAARDARAEVVQTKGEMVFALPDQEGGWDQGWVGKVKEGEYVGPIKRARDKKDAPTLTVYVINAGAAGSPADIEAKLPSFVSQEGIEVGGAKVTSAVFGKGQEEKLTVKVGYGSEATQETATLRTSTATLNNKPAFVAIVSFDTETNILVGVPTSDAAKPVFDKIARAVSISGRKRRKPRAPALPEVRTMAILADVTASSGKAEPPAKGARGLRWCEAKPDSGIGESVTFKLAQPIKLKRITVASPSGGSVNISIDGAADLATPLADGGRATVTPKGDVTSVKVAIASVGKKAAAQTCLDVGFDDANGFEIALLRGLDPAAIAALPAAVTAIQAALFEDGQPSLQPLLAFPFSVRTIGAKATKYKDGKALAKACKADRTARGCPVPANAQTGSGAFVEPTVGGDGVLELGFPAGFRATEEDVWRLKWIDAAWKLVAVDYRTKQAGQEGAP